MSLFALGQSGVEELCAVGLLVLARFRVWVRLVP